MTLPTVFPAFASYASGHRQPSSGRCTALLGGTASAPAPPATTSAIRLDGTTNDLTAAAPVDYDQAYTVAGWLRVPTALAAFGGVWSLYRDQQNLDSVEFGNTDSKAYLSNKAGNVYNATGTQGAMPTLNTWAHVAAIRTATGYEYYQDGVLVSTCTFSVGTRAGAATSMQLGRWAGSSERAPIDVAYWRAWQAVLTTTELAAEKASETAVRAGALMDEPLQAVDALGVFTATGTVTVTDGPDLTGGAFASVRMAAPLGFDRLAPSAPAPSAITGWHGRLAGLWARLRRWLRAACAAAWAWVRQTVGRR